MGARCRHRAQNRTRPRSGLGPLDAYPNKRAAPILGLWVGAAGGPDVVGTKATRWIDRSGPTGGFRVTSTGYLQTTADPDTVLVLSGILARPEKGRKADESIPQLETAGDQPFVGSLRIDLRPANRSAAIRRRDRD